MSKAPHTTVAKDGVKVKAATNAKRTSFGIVLSGNNEHQGMVVYSRDQLKMLNEATGELLELTEGDEVEAA